MPVSDNQSAIYQSLLLRYNQLPWYKSLGFWLSAPRLAWSLFGYKQNPSERSIRQLISLAIGSWLYKTAFEHEIYAAYSVYSTYMSGETALGEGELSGRKISYDPIGLISDYGSEITLLNAHAAASVKNAGRRTKKITTALLKAVAYGMESSDPAVNEPMKPSDTGGLFNSHLFAEDLLKQSPEFLLERGDVTDWAGRNFKNITAFEYALWAKDFKMLQMMMKCIPATAEGDALREALHEQATATGGFTYTLNFQRPKLDANGIPKKDAAEQWECEQVTEVRTENHFDLTPLIDAYENCNLYFSTRTQQQREACWVKIIGTQQRLAPIHILQRYCDPDIKYYMHPDFGNTTFKRSSKLGDCITFSGNDLSLFTSTLSLNFACVRVDKGRPGFFRSYGEADAMPDMIFRDGMGKLIKQLDVQSTIEIEKIKHHLSQPGPADGLALK